MKKIILSLLLSSLVAVNVFAQAQEDAPGCKDHAMFNRMPNTSIGECSSDYNEMDIYMSEDNTVKKEGTKTTIVYNYDLEEATAPSFFQIIKNYENALQKYSGKRIYHDVNRGVATLSAKNAGKEVWIVLNDGGGVKKGNFQLHILEMEPMKQEIAANVILDALNTIGSIALYINFESGKSAIMPESQGIIDQIAQMLKDNATLKISIEGHTDNVGTAASNQTLSENRAKSVMNALIAKGIDKGRLFSKGWGQTKPLGENNTDAGKAKNRRVEIVKI